MSHSIKNSRRTSHVKNNYHPKQIFYPINKKDNKLSWLGRLMIS